MSKSGGIIVKSEEGYKVVYVPYGMDIVMENLKFGDLKLKLNYEKKKRGFVIVDGTDLNSENIEDKYLPVFKKKSEAVDFLKRENAEVLCYTNGDKWFNPKLL